MKRLLTLSTVAVLGTLLTHPASADSARWPNWYLGVSGGVAFLNDDDLKGSETGKVNYKDGGMAAVALGYMPPATMQPFSNMRFEAELGYHYNSLSSATVNGAPVSTNGHLQAVSYLANVYYDIRNGSQWTPYVGAGAGGARVSLNSASGLNNTDDHTNVFAWQLMAGISYAPQMIPMTEWSVGYRYFALRDPEFDTAGGKVKIENPASSNVEIGAKFRF